MKGTPKDYVGAATSSPIGAVAIVVCVVMLLVILPQGVRRRAEFHQENDANVDAALSKLEHAQKALLQKVLSLQDTIATLAADVSALNHSSSSSGAAASNGLASGAAGADAMLKQLHHRLAVRSGLERLQEDVALLLSELDHRAASAKAAFAAAVDAQQRHYYVKWHGANGIQTSERYTTELDAVTAYEHVGDFAKKLLMYDPTKGASWTEHLPPNVARTYERLCRTSGNLPKPPKRTSLSTANRSVASAGASSDAAVEDQQHMAAIAVRAIHSSERMGQPLSSSATAKHNRATTVTTQCNTLEAELADARERAIALERRLAVKLVAHHLGGADRCVMEEVLERRAVESHHADLLGFITSSWERVRVAMSQTVDERRRGAEQEQVCRTLERDSQRLRLQSESQERLIKNLKDALDANAGALEELGALRRDLAEESKKRAASELEATKSRDERRQYKARIHELERSVEAFRLQVDGLALRHKDIVGDLEQSLRLLVIGGGGGTVSSVNHTTDAVAPLDHSRSLPPSSPLSLMKGETAAAAVNRSTVTSTTAAMAETERRKVELQFQLQDVVHELQEAKATIRALRAGIAEDALAKQQTERDFVAQRGALEHELVRLKKEDERKGKLIQQLRVELKRHEDTARELGKCRGQLAIAERRLASHNASASSENAASHRPQSRSPAKQQPLAPVDAMGTEAAIPQQQEAATTRRSITTTASATHQQRNADILDRLVQLKQFSDAGRTAAASSAQQRAAMHHSSISSVEVVDEYDDDDDL